MQGPTPKTAGTFATIACLFVLLTSGTAPATEAWSTEGAWEILVTNAENPKCFARRTMEDDTVVEIGFDSDADGGYFAMYNPAWTHINEGEKGTVRFDFGEDKFAGDAFGRYRDGVPGGYAFFNNPAFADAFARRQSVKVSGSNGREYEMDLTGTARAVAGVRSCQSEQPTSP